MTAPELAALLGVHEETIYRRARSGELPCLRLGPVVRFDPVDVKTAMQAADDRRRMLGDNVERPGSACDAPGLTPEVSPMPSQPIDREATP